MKLIKILCISILIISSSCKKEVVPSYDIVIANTNILNIENGKYLKGSIFIKGDTIAEIVSGKDLRNYTTESKIDGTGKFVLPGFWDNHIHLRGGDSLFNENKDLLPLFIINGITTVRDAGGDMTLAIHQWQEEIASGNLIGPTIYTAGPKIDGPDPTWAGSIEIDSISDIKKALDSLATLKVDFVKLYDSKINGDLYLRTIQQATKRGMITSGHMPFSVELGDAIESGLGAVEHLYYILKGSSSQEPEITSAIKNNEITFWEAMSTLTKTYNDSIAAIRFNQLNDHNTFVVPTLHIGDVLSHLDEVDHKKDAYLKIMGQGIKKTYAGRIKRAKSATENAKKSRKELNAFFTTLVKSLNESNVQLLAGSDCGAYNSYVYPGISLHKELEALQKAGLSPLEALKTSAYNGARFLKKENLKGSIEVGKHADLVILNSNPLENISNTKDIDLVIKLGMLHNPKEIAKRYHCSDCFQ